MIRYFVNLLIDPFNHFLLAILLGTIFLYRKKQWGKNFYLYALCWLFITAISPIPSWLACEWENNYSAFSPEKLIPPDSTKIHILVLGAGHSFNPNLPPNDQLSLNALGRMVEGVRIHRSIPGSKVIGSGYASTSQVPQAQVLTNTALALGVAPEDTLQIPEPHNTEAESKAYSTRFGTRTPLILVTDAIHMPRAMYWFQKAGCDPIPAPTNHLVKQVEKSPTFPFKPSIHKVEIMDKWLHEWVGMVYARWKTD